MPCEKCWNFIESLPLTGPFAQFRGPILFHFKSREKKKTKKKPTSLPLVPTCTLMIFFFFTKTRFYFVHFLFRSVKSLWIYGGYFLVYFFDNRFKCKYSPRQFETTTDRRFKMYYLRLQINRNIRFDFTKHKYFYRNRPRVVFFIFYFNYEINSPVSPHNFPTFHPPTTGSVLFF